MAEPGVGCKRGLMLVSCEMDPITDLLRSIRFSTAFYYLLAGRAPWGFRVPDLGSAKFHVVHSGRCWLHAGGSDVELGAGDVVLLASGIEHELTDPRQAPRLDIQRIARNLVTDHTYRLGIGGHGAECELLCGQLKYRSEVWDVLQLGLPPVLVVRPRDRSDRFGQLVRAARGELEQPGLGSATVLTRLGDLIVVEILRTYISGEPLGLGPGMLAGLSDRVIAAALNAIHCDPARTWTIDQLASVAIVSRSTLVARFRRIVGCSPGDYVRRWRLARAAEDLEVTDQSVQRIALGVGYGSGSAFSKAFKETFGVSPGRYRADARRAE
jgi:AraC-like DNA-binding protein